MWGQWGFSKPPDPTQCRTLAHTLCIISRSLSLPLNDPVTSPFPLLRNLAYAKVRASSEELWFPALGRPNNPTHPLGNAIWNYINSWILCTQVQGEEGWDKEGWDFDRTQRTFWNLFLSKCWHLMFCFQMDFICITWTNFLVNKLLNNSKKPE